MRRRFIVEISGSANLLNLAGDGVFRALGIPREQVGAGSILTGSRSRSYEKTKIGMNPVHPSRLKPSVRILKAS